MKRPVNLNLDRISDALTDTADALQTAFGSGKRELSQVTLDHLICMGISKSGLGEEIAEGLRQVASAIQKHAEAIEYSGGAQADAIHRLATAIEEARDKSEAPLRVREAKR
jgi:hypothetical protein